jgi:hypothetical protein
MQRHRHLFSQPLIETRAPVQICRRRHAGDAHRWQPEQHKQHDSM